jgi:hypothetical protein
MNFSASSRFKLLISERTILEVETFLISKILLGNIKH